MRDLRKHALDEYEDLYRDEQELIKQGRNAEGKKKRKKRKRKNKNATAFPDEGAEIEVEETEATVGAIEAQTEAGRESSKNRCESEEQEEHNAAS